VAHAWAELPIDQPVVIEGPTASALALSLEPLPADAPAVITYEAAAPSRPADLIDDLLDRLDQVARELYPAWLPAAAVIDDPAGAGVSAVRSIALREARHGGNFGPFLADLAERALRGAAGHDRFTPETRAAELGKVLASSFARGRIAILIRLPTDLMPINEQVFVSAGRWLTDRGGFGMWFVGGALGSVDNILRVRWLQPPVNVGMSGGPADAGDAKGASVGYPAIAGQPHPASWAEQSLEAALASAGWAAGREWNQLYQAHPLTNPIRVDLLWRAEHCVVEIDGEEHREPERFAADRQRDVQLQLAGYAVLRFTNKQVVYHRDLVISQIRQFLDTRRTECRERAIYERPEAFSAGTHALADPHGR
jgi:hypothetical protein